MKKHLESVIFSLPKIRFEWLFFPDDFEGEEEEGSVPEKKKRKTRDISPIEWDRKSEGKSEEEEGEEEDGKSEDNKSEKSEDSTARSKHSQMLQSH